MMLAEKKSNPLKSVPLNRHKVYVRGIMPNGCEVYLPVASRDDDVIHKVKADLQAYLDTFPKPGPLVA